MPTVARIAQVIVLFFSHNLTWDRNGLSQSCETAPQSTKCDLSFHQNHANGENYHIRTKSPSISTSWNAIPINFFSVTFSLFFFSCAHKNYAKGLRVAMVLEVCTATSLIASFSERSGSY